MVVINFQMQLTILSQMPRDQSVLMRITRSFLVKVSLREKRPVTEENIHRSDVSHVDWAVTHVDRVGDGSWWVAIYLMMENGIGMHFPAWWEGTACVVGFLDQFRGKDTHVTSHFVLERQRRSFGAGVEYLCRKSKYLGSHVQGIE